MTTADGVTGRIVAVRVVPGGLYDFEFVYTVSPSGHAPTDLFTRLECVDATEDDIDAADPPVDQPPAHPAQPRRAATRGRSGRRRADHPNLFDGLADD